MSAAACSWRHTEWTPYEVLNVPPSAPIGDIRAAFKCMALHTHPDKATVTTSARRASGSGATSCSEFPVSFHIVKEASEMLLDPYLRAAYDAARSQALTREVGAISDTYSLMDDFVRVRMDGDESDRQRVHVYQRECRCGGVYEVAVFPEAPAGSGEDEDVPLTYSARTLRCECDSCSLVVEVVA
ncbi:putative chaperone protein DNAj [Leishmania major strain Friedlin]|uniref:Putative chaperone protein DNAj n=1 Tax=Leishmania major TaxID=5664 RepID=Q4QDP0_LEIMA|nr:putative chaperone protein DNAj [Leishmania major strain Friedlin]CAG9572537.1 chaperone_protein_DNAj_-_putative [Leishmania major strain Friedlin]CAJ04269.1 putative chaperone protein DNAj [Leishmania major strain Friedlin]|eukprot:XP_001682558.1 putative chaperone protein DNAj [Leishmania major strain Friedlin]